MKTNFKKFALMTLVIALLSSVNCFANGNGNLVSTEIEVSSFERINIGSSANVRYHSANEHRVVVTIDENLVEYLEVRTRGNVLNIGLQRVRETSHRFLRGDRTTYHNHRPTSIVVDVYSPLVTNVSISGSGRFTTVDKLVTSTFKASISGSGRVEGTIECDNFSGSISGSGRINVSGTTNRASISISGSGSFTADEFEAKNVTVSISGSGSANVAVSESLKARVSGSGRVVYCGEPRNVDAKMSGSGSIRKM
jgi:hypothetical protein